MSWITSDDIPIAGARAIISPCLLSSHNTSWTYRPPALVQHQLLVGTTGSWWINFRAVDIYCIEASLMWVGLLNGSPPMRCVIFVHCRSSAILQLSQPWVGQKLWTFFSRCDLWFLGEWGSQGWCLVAQGYLLSMYPPEASDGSKIHGWLQQPLGTHESRYFSCKMLFHWWWAFDFNNLNNAPQRSLPGCIWSKLCCFQLIKGSKNNIFTCGGSGAQKIVTLILLVHHFLKPWSKLTIPMFFFNVSL